ncbi:SPOR domain-containing protein [Commensalibacter oyaizuii]|uniref:SPOR domain-containing protein n=1 Tax=Commensalibacter oyaizuii TaxID=3043873 RepID=A0ABT6Q3E8_9PROT|nr:SPOR domain-containing protein [Commensalibacter sp. TBRC 16381]MDI2091555.1 SPOR domain-containing protein [Commensalibacter sp. TBRC 16381]
MLLTKKNQYYDCGFSLLFHFFPLFFLLLLSACGGDKPKPVTVQNNEQIIPSQNTGEPPILIVSSSNKNVIEAQQRKLSRSPKRTRNTAAPTPISIGENAGIQIGAFSSQTSAQHALSQAQKVSSQLANARTLIKPLNKKGQTLYRAQFTGIDFNHVIQTCTQLKQAGIPCTPL